MRFFEGKWLKIKNIENNWENRHNQSMEKENAVLNISNLSKKFGDETVLHQLSFHVSAGTIVGLLGPNGSGKTTLLKILAGLVSPTEGTVDIFGHQPGAPALKNLVGWMPAEERTGFYGRLSGRANLEFFASLYDLPKKETNRLIGNLAFLLDADGELEKQALQTSSGARQKVALARTLLHNPSLLLLDEPLRNLDPHAVKRFRRLLRDHLTRREKKTIILSSHHLDEMRRLLDHVIVLREGTIVYSSPMETLEKELRNKTWEEFYMNLIDAKEQAV